VQYLLAADRGNEKVADYYCLHHPAVLRTLARIAGAGASAGREVTVCGEMAHIDGYVPFLVGIGLRSLSVDPRHLPRLRNMLSRLSPQDAEEHAARVLKAATVEEAGKAISSF
jgi:phosphotransferase system enzyme I (PtsP)